MRERESKKESHRDREIERKRERETRFRISKLSISLIGSYKMRKKMKFWILRKSFCFLIRARSQCRNEGAIFKGGGSLG